MIEKEPNFFVMAYTTFYKFSQTDPENIGFIFSRNIQYPTIEFLPSLQVVIPLPKKQGDSYVFEGMVFDDTEKGKNSMWSLFLATIYHMAGHAAVSDYTVYERWRDDKTQEVCSQVIDFIEDLSVEKYISHTDFEIWENLKNIKSKFESIGDQNTIKKTNIGQQVDFKVFCPLEDQKRVDDLKLEIIGKRGGEDHHETMLSYADFIYKNREFLPKIILPYCEHHDFYPVIKTEKKGIELEPVGVEFNEKIVQLDELWSINEATKTRILKRHRKHLKGLQFDKVIIPAGDYHKFLKLRSETKPLLRRIRQQIRMIANMNDDSMNDKMGNVDMQMAIQAIASDGQGVDIFDREETRRGEEAWLILVDKSASMNLRFDRIKEFTVCMAESAGELAGKSDAWALYSFDNNFQIIKDFKEKYNQEVQARIGSMDNGGLSLLPDAIEFANRILSEDPRERKFLFVITDAHPSGYDKIQEALSKIVKKTEISGTILIGIGVTKGITATFRNYAKGHDLRQLVAKFISAYRTAAAIE